MTAPHHWIKSTLGHGSAMCSKCSMTDAEAAALGLSNRCDVLDQVPQNGAVAHSAPAPLSHARQNIYQQGPYRIHAVDVIVLSEAGSRVRQDMEWHPFNRAAAIALGMRDPNARLYGNFYQNLFCVLCSDTPIRFES